MAHALCPNCQGPLLELHASMSVSYQISYDDSIGDVVIVSEEQGDVDWDEQAVVKCPNCQWQGSFKDLSINK